MKKTLAASLVTALVVLAVYLLNIRYGVRDGEETYRGRTLEYSAIAMSVLSYYPSRHQGRLPESLQDPALQEPVTWSYLQMKERVAFNSLYLGRAEKSLTEEERKTPFIIEKTVRPSGEIVICDYDGQIRRLTATELDSTNLNPEARAELVAVLPKS